jgi:hypothetical protein
MTDQAEPKTARKLLNSKSVRARYDDVSPRTLERWIVDGRIPAPIRIGRLRFWDERKLEESEAARDGRQ